MIAYHISDKNFTKFSMKYVGLTQGSDYGYGLYFSESVKLAKEFSIFRNPILYVVSIDDKFIFDEMEKTKDGDFLYKKYIDLSCYIGEKQTSLYLSKNGIKCINYDGILVVFDESIIKIIEKRQIYNDWE